MPGNLFAACRVGENLVVRRVQLDRAVQDQVERVFVQQKKDFFKGVDLEVSFGSMWKPDFNELLTIQVPEEALVFERALAPNTLSVDPIDAANFADAGIRALFSDELVNGNYRILVQRFTNMQLLSRRFTLFFRGNTFRRFRDPAFHLDTSLTFVIEGGLIKFKSFHKLRSILNVGYIFREATNSEILTFVQHPCLAVVDLDGFFDLADEVIRKLISTVVASGILEDFTVVEIRDAALLTKLEIVLEDGAMVLPADRREVKNILRFLDESRYSGPLTGTPYETNSRRPVQV